MKIKGKYINSHAPYRCLIELCFIKISTLRDIKKNKGIFSTIDFYVVKIDALYNIQTISNIAYTIINRKLDLSMLISTSSQDNHSHSLISAFIIRSLKRIKAKLATCTFFSNLAGLYS